MVLAQVGSGGASTDKPMWGARFQEKRLRLYACCTVPQTDTGGRVEKTKANECEVLKELGKKAAVTSG